MMDFGFYNMDCLDGMRDFPDKFFDLAIVDPPYGDAKELSDNSGGGVLEPIRAEVRPVQADIANGRMYDSRTERGVTRTGGTWARKYTKKSLRGTSPREKNISMSFSASHETRLSGGGNYFRLPPTRCFVVWRKLTISETFTMAMAEYAWTSFDGNAKVFECAPQGKPGDRFHPTQKPVELYRWLLNQYAKPGDIILDTHVGSASSLIACHDTGHKYVGFEIDPEYYQKATARLERATAQINIFDLGIT